MVHQETAGAPSEKKVSNKAEVVIKQGVAKTQQKFVQKKIDQSTTLENITCIVDVQLIQPTNKNPLKKMKTTPNLSPRTVVAVVSMTCFGFSWPSQGQTILSYANDWNYNVAPGASLVGTNYFASSTDLANAGQSTLASAVWSGGASGDFGSSPAQLNNGLYAPAFLPNPAFVDAGTTEPTLLATFGSTYTITFTGGMNLTSIDVYSAYTSNDRSKQNWSLDYRIAGSGSYTALVAPDLALNVAQDSNGNRQGPWLNKVTLTLATGEFDNIDSLRFTFLEPVYNEATDGANSTFLPTAYREIDVFGAPIPEPSTYALILGGFAALLMAVRRRRRSLN